MAKNFHGFYFHEVVKRFDLNGEDMDAANCESYFFASIHRDFEVFRKSAKQAVAKWLKCKTKEDRITLEQALFETFGEILGDYILPNEKADADDVREPITKATITWDMVYYHLPKAIYEEYGFYPIPCSTNFYHEGTSL